MMKKLSYFATTFDFLDVLFSMTQLSRFHTVYTCNKINIDMTLKLLKK